MHVRNSPIISFTPSYAMQCWHAWQAGDEQRTNRDWGLHILDTTLDFDRFSFLSKGVDHLSHQLIDLGCHLEEQLNPTRSDLQVSTKSQTSLALSRTQETWGALSVPLQLTTFEDDENLEIVELMSMIIKMMVIKMMVIKMMVIEMVMIKVLHSWKNVQTAQTRLCYFSGLLCYFLPVDMQVLFFVFCCENDIKYGWINTG